MTTFVFRALKDVDTQHRRISVEVHSQHRMTSEHQKFQVAGEFILTQLEWDQLKLGLVGDKRKEAGRSGVTIRIEDD